MRNFKKDVFGEGGMLHRYFGESYEIRDEQSRAICLLPFSENSERFGLCH